jgi:porin
MMQSFKTGKSCRRAVALLVAGAAASALATSAQAADGPLSYSLDYTADVGGVLDGGLARRGRVLDDLSLTVDLDLGAALGWSNTTAHMTVLNNSGGMPNEDAGTLQGVDNIEVSRHRTRLFEAWVETGFADGKGTVLAGLYDVNSEFYANDSAGLLIAPAFGIGSELAATGPNGPSIFPSTALAVRLKWTTEAGGYAQAVVLNARSGVLGDPDGIDTSFDSGVLMIGEVGWQGAGKLAIGAWRYSDKQDDWRLVDAAGDPVRQKAGGVYLLAERRIRGSEDSPGRTTAFLRAGVSDGTTSAFDGGWQAGILVEQPFASRPDSQWSVGVNQAFISGRERANGVDAGRDIGRTEMAFEVTYSDKLGPVTVQPDLQYIIRPSGDRDIDNALVATLRLSVSY